MPVTTDSLKSALVLSEERDKLEAKITAAQAKFEADMQADVNRLHELNREISVHVGSNGRASSATVTRPRAQRGSIDRDGIVAFIAANPGSKAGEIGAATGISGTSLSNVLGQLVKDGKLAKQGQRRGTTYTAA